MTRVIDRDFTAYSMGLHFASACTSLDDDAATEAMNSEPGGLGTTWRIASDKTFRTGEPNGCPCPDAPGRRHLLFEAPVLREFVDRLAGEGSE